LLYRLRVGEVHIDPQALVDAVDSPAIVHDHGAVVVAANAAARSLLRFATEPELHALGGPFARWQAYLAALEAGVFEERFALSLEEADLELTCRARPLAGDDGPLVLVTLRVARRAEGSYFEAKGAHDGLRLGYYALDAVVDHAGDVVDFVFTDMNRAAEVQLRLERDRVVGQSLRELLPAHDGGGFFAQYAEVYESGRALQQRFQLPGDVWASGWYEQVVLPREGGLAVYGRDVNDVKRAELFLRTALDVMPDPVFIAQKDGTIDEANPAATRVFGYSREELLGAKLGKLMPAEVAAEHDEYIARYLETGEAKIIGSLREVIAEDSSGRHFPVRLGVGEIRLGETHAFVGTVHDLRDVRALEDRLRHTQKIDALGRLAAGVAHDFNNLLVVIKQNAQLLALDVAGDAREVVDEIAEAGERAATLCRQLLEFSRRDAVARSEDVDVRGAIAAFVSVISRALGETHDVEMELPDAPCFVHIDRGRFEQILLNLVINARDAMDAGTIRVSLSNEDGWVALEVRDQGTGIDESIRSQIFEPFFTTKPKGSGLGLATVFGIVTAADGRIGVESSPGDTRFRVVFPAVNEPKARPLSEPAPPSESRALRVMLVEDDGLVRAATGRWLRREGHQVHSFEDGPAALEALERVAPDVLVADVVMPGMSGSELAREARRRRPKLAVLFVSGHAIERFEDVDFEHLFLAKPFDAEALRDALNRLA